MCFSPLFPLALEMSFYLCYWERCDAAIFQLGLGKATCPDVLLCGAKDNKNEDNLDEIFVYENFEKVLPINKNDSKLITKSMTWQSFSKS